MRRSPILMLESPAPSGARCSSESPRVLIPGAPAAMPVTREQAIGGQSVAPCIDNGTVRSACAPTVTSTVKGQSASSADSAFTVLRSLNTYVPGRIYFRPWNRLLANAAGVLPPLTVGYGIDAESRSSDNASMVSFSHSMSYSWMVWLPHNMPLDKPGFRPTVGREAQPSAELYLSTAPRWATRTGGIRCQTPP